MGPTCEVVLESSAPEALDAIDSLLASLATPVERTREGAVREIWIRGRPVQVSIKVRPVATLSAGCNDEVDYAVLRELSAAIIATVGGSASEPEK